MKLYCVYICVNIIFIFLFRAIDTIQASHKAKMQKLYSSNIEDQSESMETGQTFSQNIKLKPEDNDETKCEEDASSKSNNLHDATTGGKSDAPTGGKIDAPTGGKSDAPTGGKSDATTGGKSDDNTVVDSLMLECDIYALTSDVLTSMNCLTDAAHYKELTGQLHRCLQLYKEDKHKLKVNVPK